MMKFASALLVVLVALAVFSPVESCSRRRNNRPPNVFINRVPLPPFIAPPTNSPNNNIVFTLPPPTPTATPTARPSKTPTAFPTPEPTAVPTPLPTPPPPPPDNTGFVPTPDRGTQVKMERPKCLKSSEFRRQNDGQIKEEWIYACSFNIYVTVDLGTITEPTPCACGVKLDNPTGNSGPIPTNMTTTIDYVRLVIYDEITKQVKGEITNYPFSPNPNTTNALLAEHAGTDMDYSSAVAGFAGIARPFPDAPKLLDQTLPGQQGNVPAICFQVTQTFTTRYQWPEPPLPKMHEAPNIFVTDCQPNRIVNQGTLKRQSADQTSADTQWFRDFLVFTRNVQTGNFVARNRYITSFYTNSECTTDKGFVSFDRQFNSEIKRSPLANNGLFSWTRSYTDVHVIAGVPKAFSAVTNYLSDGYYKISWTQTYNIQGEGPSKGQVAPGLLRAALLGDNSFAACNGQCQFTKLCTAVPAPFSPTTIADKMDNDDAANLAIFSTAGLDCAPHFRRCDGETTWLAFQNFGASSRDFSKLSNSHLFTGPRTLFCSTIGSQVLDTLEFKPLDVSKMLRKRGERDSISVTKRSIFDQLQSGLKEVGNSRLAIPLADPVLEAIPQPTELGLQPGTGSADGDGRPQGDHPVDLFREAYTAPVSVKQDDTSCGSFGGGANGVDDYCLGLPIADRPPCLPGQRGCSCRATSQNKCDLGLSCSDTNFCLASACPAGRPGCKCNSDNTCSVAGYSCGVEGLCFFDTASFQGRLGGSCSDDVPCQDAGASCAGVCMKDSTPAGSLGGNCTGQCSQGTCDTALGVCTQTCNPGAPGCDCSQGSLCASGFTCKSNKKCGAVTCNPGEIGCPCLNGNTCSKTGLKCVAMRADGSEKACLGEALCTHLQGDRCKSYCGANNVHFCPPCAYQVPVCFVTLDSSASGLSASIVLAIVAFVAALLF